MDISKLPPSGAAANRAQAATVADRGSQAADNIAPLADRADIRPLDIPGALQILLAEVRAAFGQQPELASAGSPSGGATVESPVQAAQQLVEMVLQAMPDDAPDVSAWTAALVRAESALQAGGEQAANAVSAWRDVPAAAVDAVRETRALIFTVFGDEPQNPLWLRPEWAGFAPRLERFTRRRRLARRRLMDPDYSSGGAHDSDGK
jgi:hypothetical protein